MGESDTWRQIGNELSDAILQGLRQARLDQECQHEARQRDFGGHDERFVDAVEALAAHCHDEQWSGWMSYLFSKCQTIPHDSFIRPREGSVVIPPELAERWKWQMNTPYSDLPEQMKASDREEGRAILRVLKEPE